MAYGPTKLKMKDEIKLREKLTNTTIFILPVFKVPILKLDEYGFVNAFLYDKNKPDTLPDSKTIYVLFKPNEEQIIQLQKQIEDWDNNGFLVGDYDYSGGYVVVSLKFPDKFRDQYKIFLKGKYSEFSAEYKENFPQKLTVVIPSTGQLQEEDSLQWCVINKRVKLKNYWEDKIGEEFDPTGEYWSKPILSYETMDVDQIINDNLTDKTIN